MSELAHTGRLLWLALRRDRLVLVLAVAGVAGSLVATAVSYRGLYPTPAARAQAAAAISSNASLIAVAGPARALDTLGGLTVWKTGLWAAMALGLTCGLLAVRHTRGEEEREQTELLLATATGRYAPLAAALSLVAVLSVATAAVATLGLAATAIGVSGSIAAGCWLLGAGLVFGAVGAVAAQLGSTARAANGLSAAALGLAFALRAVGDTGNGGLTWFSPLGWGEQLRPFARERWWPLLLPVLTFVALTTAARVLLVRRDLGSGILQARPGPARAVARLRQPLGFAWRLQRASLVSWTVGLFAAGVAFGGAARSLDELTSMGGATRELILRGGGENPHDQFLAAMVVPLALLASSYAVQSAQRPRGDEISGRVEALLATGLGRLRWVGAHLTLAVLGSMLLLVVAGIGLGSADAATGHGLSAIPRDAGAALVQAPAVCCLIGIVALLLGAAPRAVGIAWGAVGACFLIWILGPILDFPGRVLGLSPFQHLPALPAASLSITPLLVLSGIAAALMLTGLFLLGRRDISPGS